MLRTEGWELLRIEYLVVDDCFVLVFTKSRLPVQVSADEYLFNECKTARRSARIWQLASTAAATTTTTSAAKPDDQVCSSI